MPTLLITTASIRGDKAASDAKVLFDTGASFSFVRRDVAERSGTITKLPTPLRFTLGDGNQIEITDTVVLSLMVGNQQVMDNFMVIDSGVEEIVLGAATMRKFGLKIDLEHSAVYAALNEDAKLETRNSKFTVEEVPMDEKLKTLMARLGLTVADGMTDDQAIEAIAAKATAPVPEKPAIPVASPAILALIECNADASDAEVRGKIMALKNPGNVVPAQELVALKAQLHERDISDTVNGALAEGKLTPAEKEWALGQAKADLPAFKAFVAHRPQQVPLNVTLPRDEPQAAAAKIDDTQVLINKQLGISNETFAKYATQRELR